MSNTPSSAPLRPETLAAIPVFFCDAMVANADSFSPSAAKPGPVVQQWMTLGIPLDIRAPLPVTRDQLCLAHDKQMVDEILDLQRENGFGNRMPEVARSLPYTSGAMLCAARESIANGKVAVAPVSGFHHARHDLCAGFCTFNGLMVTAQVLYQSGEARKVGILDFDQHVGDGTQDIIRKLGLDYIHHFSAGMYYSYPHQAGDFLGSIQDLVTGMRDCDVILYQAGADPHIDDPLGGWLDDEQLAHRDGLVFQTAARIGVPVAWNLAGGYQDPIKYVLAIHDRTLIACANTFLQLTSPPEG